MRAVSRVSLVLAVVVAPLVAVAPFAQAAPVDCAYNKAKKLVTITIENTESTGSLVIEREPGTSRIGYTAEGHSWRGCEGARTSTTNKVKVVGSTLSEEIYLDLGYGAFAPGATAESSGASEIEFQLDLGTGTDRVTLVGGRGTDRLAFVKPGQAKLNGDDDIDVTMTGVDRWEIYGDDGSDVLDGSGAPQVQIWGGAGSDRLIGGAGPDGLYGDDDGELGGDDTLIGGDGNDYMRGYVGSDVLSGGEGDDSLSGYEQRDVLKGGPGDDSFGTLDSKDGADVYDGGPGNDSMSYYYRAANVRVSLDGKANDGAKNEADNVSGSIERIYGGEGNDTLIGNDAPNDINGEAGNDVLKGLGGDDDLNEGDGNDTVLGGSGDEHLYNSEGQDRYYGGDGNDYMSAGSSADGRDVFSGGNGSDRIDYGGRSGVLAIDVTDPGGDGDVGTSENDNVLPDFEEITGGSGSDEIRGGPKSEELDGGGSIGNDTLIGRGGPDTLDGNDGNDVLHGGEGYDRIYGEGGEDSIDSFDEGEDSVDCGWGTTDTVTAADVFDSISNCDVVPF